MPISPCTATANHPRTSTSEERTGALARHAASRPQACMRDEPTGAVLTRKVGAGRSSIYTMSRWPDPLFADSLGTWVSARDCFAPSKTCGASIMPPSLPPVDHAIYMQCILYSLSECWKNETRNLAFFRRAVASDPQESSQERQGRVQEPDSAHPVNWAEEGSQA